MVCGDGGRAPSWSYTLDNLLTCVKRTCDGSAVPHADCYACWRRSNSSQRA
jgi:hypothetical protein